MSADTQLTHQTFVDRFTKVWRERTPDLFIECFHPGATFFWPVMSRPAPVTELASTVTRFLAMVPDLEFRVDRWSGTEDVIFIEWTMRFTLAGQPLEGAGTDRFLMQGDRATDMRAYSDTRPLLRAMGFDVPEDLLAMVAG